MTKNKILNKLGQEIYSELYNLYPRNFGVVPANKINKKNDYR